MSSFVFDHIFITGRSKNPGVSETLRALIALFNELQLRFCIEQEIASLLNEPHQHPVVDYKNIDPSCNLVIVVGGDGSLLGAVHDIVDLTIPVLGINRGSLGFLTDIHPTELKSHLLPVLMGEHVEEQRFLLEVSIEHQGQSIHDHALNELTLQPKQTPALLAFSTYINDEFVCNQRSDGIIIATPTGSTAYALSGGGPILHPALDAMVLVPMFPHTLSLRPIVIDGNSIITLKLYEQDQRDIIVSCDSQHHHIVSHEMRVHIKKKEQPLKLIHPKQYRYYETLRTKLHWGNKPFDPPNE